MCNAAAKQLQRSKYFDVRMFIKLFICFGKKKKLKSKYCFAYLIKSFLQKSFPSRLKHLSIKGPLQSLHRTQCWCHRRSHTFRRNFSKMGWLQPAQWSPTPTDCSAWPVTKHKIIVTGKLKKHKLYNEINESVCKCVFAETKTKLFIHASKVLDEGKEREKESFGSEFMPTRYRNGQRKIAIAKWTIQTGSVQCLDAYWKPFIDYMTRTVNDIFVNYVNS